MVGEGTTVVAAQQTHHLALRLPIGDTLTQPGILPFRTCLDVGIHLLVSLRILIHRPLVKGLDDLLADGSKLVVQGA